MQRPKEYKNLAISARIKNMELQTEAILLACTPYGEHDRILTLFTEEVGLLKLFAKGRRLKRGVEPLTVASYLYQSGKRELGRLHEASLIRTNLHLRKSYELLMTAQKCASALLLSQMPGKPSPRLYHLLRLFLDKLPSLDLSIALSSFLLKLLKHEGLFSQEEAAPYFSEEERKSLLLLAHAQSWELLGQIPCNPEFAKRVENWCNHSLEIKPRNGLLCAPTVLD